MTNKTYIKNFNFAEAKFETIPPEVFQTNPKTLSSMDRAILEGIKFQSMVSKYNDMMQNTIYKVKNLRLKILDTELNPIQHLNYSSLLTYQSINWLEIKSKRVIRNLLVVPLFLFILLSLTYYANVNLNLGMNFLTELFA